MDRFNKFVEEDGFVQYLKDQNYGMLIIQAQPEMDIMAHVLEIPLVVRILGLTKMAANNLYSGQSPFYSYEPNVFSPNVFGRKLFDSVEEYS